MAKATTVELLKRRIQSDPSFAEGLHQLRTTAEASRFCNANGLNVAPELLWTQRGHLFADGQPTWRG